MNKVKQCTYPQIGTVTYTYRIGSRRITLRVKKDNSIHVTIPYLVKFSFAEDFVLSKTDWIVSRLHENLKHSKPIVEFTTKYHIVHLQADNNITKNRVIKTGNEIIIFHPISVESTSKGLQEYAKKVITEVLRAEAKYYLPNRVKELAAKHGFGFGNVTIRNSKSRWGSCSGKNNISLSLRLMCLPNDLIDYVILHELCHTKEKNHGSRFWQLLDSVCGGNSKSLSKQLKKHPIPL
ncbi:MAG: SprT family zinc-dependent metalloprotease [Bacteroidota bacterium]